MPAQKRIHLFSKIPNHEYLMLEDSPIKVAQYYTQLPDKQVLHEKLQKAIAIAREQIDRKEDSD